jgi:hypothetical protein
MGGHQFRLLGISIFGGLRADDYGTTVTNLYMLADLLVDLSADLYHHQTLIYWEEVTVWKNKLVAWMLRGIEVIGCI